MTWKTPLLRSPSRCRGQPLHASARALAPSALWRANSAFYFGCSLHSGGERGAALAMAHAGLPRPGHDLECHHFVLDCSAPVLVLAAKHHDACFYLLVNLADSASRQAISKAYGFSGLEFVMIDGATCASSYIQAVADECRR